MPALLFASCCAVAEPAVLMDPADTASPTRGTDAPEGGQAEVAPASVTPCVDRAAGGGGTSVELYDPAADAWFTAADLPSVHRRHAASVLLADGRVLVVGGTENNWAGVSTAALYDPARDCWAALPELPDPRTYPAAIALPDGRALVLGGDTVQLLDPIRLEWETPAPPPVPFGHGIVALTPAGVLVAGGFIDWVVSDTASLFDPLSGKWGPAGRLDSPRAYATATSLMDGRVLIAAGEDVETEAGHNNLASAEVYDPADGSFTPTGSLATPHAFGQCAVLLADGRVLVSGGEKNGPGGETLDTAEIWDPVSGSWTSTATMTDSRLWHGCVTLADGRVLAAGGHLSNLLISSKSSTEIYDPTTDLWVEAAPMAAPRAAFDAVLLNDGRVVVAGGYGS